MIGASPIGSRPISSRGVQSGPGGPPDPIGPLNYIRYKLGIRGGALHLNLDMIYWSLFAQLSPADFEAPIAKGLHLMTPGSPLLEIAVPAAVAPAGWYMLVLSDADRTTTLASPVWVD